MAGHCLEVNPDLTTLISGVKVAGYAVVAGPARQPDHQQESGI